MLRGPPLGRSDVRCPGRGRTFALSMMRAVTSAGHGGPALRLVGGSHWPPAVHGSIVGCIGWVSVSVIATLAGIGLIGLILVDAFETVVLPRRVTRRFRLTRLIVLNSWRVWVRVARQLPSTAAAKGQESAKDSWAPLGRWRCSCCWASGRPGSSLGSAS